MSMKRYRRCIRGGSYQTFFFSVWDCVGFFVCVKEEIKEDINAEAFALKEQMCVSAIY